MGAGAGEQPAAPVGKREGLHRVQASVPPVVDPQSKFDRMGGVMKKVGLKEREKKESWNTGKLSSRVAVDVMSAATAGGLVAPLITMIDK